MVCRDWGCMNLLEYFRLVNVFWFLFWNKFWLVRMFGELLEFEVFWKGWMFGLLNWFGFLFCILLFEELELDEVFWVVFVDKIWLGNSLLFRFDEWLLCIVRVVVSFLVLYLDRFVRFGLVGSAVLCVNFENFDFLVVEFEEVVGVLLLLLFVVS